MRKGKDLEIEIAYIHGRLEAQIEGFANGLGISPVELTARLAALLLRPPSGEILGASDRVPTLRGETSGVYPSTRKVAVAGGAHRGTQVSAKSSTQSSFWSKMTPEQRSIEMRRRRKVAIANRKK